MPKNIARSISRIMAVSLDLNNCRDWPKAKGLGVKAVQAVIQNMTVMNMLFAKIPMPQVVEEQLLFELLRHKQDYGAVRRAMADRNDNNGMVKTFYRHVVEFDLKLSAAIMSAALGVKVEDHLAENVKVSFLVPIPQAMKLFFVPEDHVVHVHDMDTPLRKWAVATAITALKAQFVIKLTMKTLEIANTWAQVAKYWPALGDFAANCARDRNSQLHALKEDVSHARSLGCIHLELVRETLPAASFALAEAQSLFSYSGMPQPLKSRLTSGYEFQAWRFAKTNIEYRSPLPENTKQVLFGHPIPAIVEL